MDFESHKTQLIDKYLLPDLGDLGSQREEIKHQLHFRCNYHKTIAQQLLETSDYDVTANLWFPINTIIHAYQYFPEKGNYGGTRIWQPQEIVHSNSSYVQKPDSKYCLETLKAGDVLSISHENLQILIKVYNPIANRMLRVYQENEAYILWQQHLLSLPAKERIALFKKERAEFVEHAKTNKVAMQLWLTRQTYSAYS